MKTYKFRVTQPLVGYYEGECTIIASSEKKAREKLENMTTNDLEMICDNWDQATDDAYADGEIEIQQLIDVE